MTTFLTRVYQHELRLRAGKAPDLPDTRHKDVMSIFGELGPQARANASILFRLEDYVDKPAAYIVRSLEKPKNAPSSAETYQEDFSHLTDNMPVSFRISINAIQRTKNGIRPVFADGEIESALNQEDFPSKNVLNGIEITDWLAEKLDPALREIHILNHQREVLGATRSGRRKKGSNKVIQIDTIDGVAVIGNNEILKNMMIKGIGRAKSYGCGLLTVRPLTL